MATFVGRSGVVMNGSNAIAEVKSYSITSNAEVIEDTNLGDTTKSFVAGNTSWNGSLDCFFDDTDTSGQVTLRAGSSITLNLYMEGSSTGSHKFSGTVIITDITMSAAINGMVEASFSFQGTGTLTEGTV